jgi:hypothetical protein
VCLEEAQLKAIGFAEDEVLLRDAQHEYKRLLDLLNLLIPDGDPEDDHGDG